MKLHHILVATLVTSFLDEPVLSEKEQNKQSINSSRLVRQTSADQMVQNILQWLQGVYSQQSRRIRQGTFREYLPPANTQRPRPFEPLHFKDTHVQNGNFINEGYSPISSVTLQHPFSVYSNPALQPGAAELYPSTTSPTGPGFTEYPTHQPEISTQGPPIEFTRYPTTKSSYSSTNVAVKYEGTELEKTGYSTQPPPEKPNFWTQQPPSFSTGYHIEQPYLSTDLPQQSELLPEISTSLISTQGPSTQALVTLTSVSPTEAFTPAPTTQSPETNTIPTEKIKNSNGSEPTDSIVEDLKHPPHIHAVNVECAKDMMTINIEFDREFNGVIYSKGYFNMPECRYVKENSGQTNYSFTVNLNMCGTEFINAFDKQGQSYLENVLILQNEPEIQEIWDMVRAVRCLWEGNLKESLSVALSVGMLTQELVTFRGDTAMAKLDIVLGKGPFGQPADGLVRIGEPMTLVISVSGDTSFDIQVKDCKATDSIGDNVLPLTDDNGCILKPKLFGSFQKTRNTTGTGPSIFAYAYFNAFKFPDVMDLLIECNIELCKIDCEICSNPNQQVDPGRRKRDLNSLNHKLHEEVTMGKHLRIILPEDLNGRTVVELGKNDGICMSTHTFMLSSFLLISLLTASCLFNTYILLKTQRFNTCKH